MAQRLVVVDAGRVVQHDSPIAVYDDPRFARSLDLIGFPHANLLPGRIEGGFVEAGPLRLATGQGNGDIVAGLRPEGIHFEGSPRGAKEDLHIDARVTLIENLGGEAVVYLDAGHVQLTAALPLSRIAPPEFGAEVTVTVDPADVMLFDAASGARLDGGKN
jgi:multiple sugar transport system ATP-binding protein